MSSTESDQQHSFELITALSYDPTAPPPLRFSLLPLHLARLREAHAALAQECPGSWCAARPCPSDMALTEVLEEVVKGKEDPQRVRLVVDCLGRPRAEAFALSPMPHYPVRLVLNSEPTDYDSAFLRFKTSQRAVYDQARAAQGATLHPSSHPSSPPFDVVLFNTANQLTETTIANIAFKLDPSQEKYVTPAQDCGLLPGMARRDLLQRGEIVEGVVTIEEVRRAAREGTSEVICFNAVRGVYKAIVTF